MTILDDARPGMDPETRPQDDLFGHVNGRWLREAEIPSDRSSWGAFVKLADDAEQQVREIIEGLADRVESDGDGGVDEDARKIGALYASFMDEVRINKLGLRPVQPLLSAVDALRDVRDLAAFLGEFERVGGYGLFGSYVNTDDRDSDRYVLNIFQGGLGLPDESYYRDDKFAEVRDKYVAYLEKMLGLAGHDDPPGAARTILEIDTRLAATGNGPRPGTCRRPTT
jgi:endothelin-converting enzyme/putative endopeptidase